MRINLVTTLLVITVTIVLLLLVPLSVTSQSITSSIVVSGEDAKFNLPIRTNPGLDTAIRAVDRHPLTQGVSAVLERSLKALPSEASKKHPKVVSATGADSVRNVSLDTSQIQARPAIGPNARIQVQGADDVQWLALANPFTDIPPPTETSETPIPTVADTPPSPTNTPLPSAIETPIPKVTDTPLPTQEPLTWILVTVGSIGGIMVYIFFRLPKGGGISTAQIRRELNMNFDDVQLSALCLDDFPEVYDKFGDGMRKDKKITLLLDHCRRHRTPFQLLLESVRKEYKESNPQREELKPLIDALEAYLKKVSRPSASRPSKKET